MASIINAATSGGLVTTADTSGILQLQTAGTTAVTVDASQKVGIGTTAPAKPLHILTSATTEVWVESTSTQKAILNLNAGDVSVSMTSTYNAGGTAARPFIFYNVSTPLLQFDLSKSVALQGATPASGTGITFPATQSASSDANTLDDYEEGTWTPSLSSIGNWTGTPTTTYAKYIKIGQSVFIEFSFSGTVTTGSTTTYFLTTLPITATSTSVSCGSNQAEGTIGTILANATTNCYVWFPASSGLTSGAHNPTGTATYSSAN